MTPDRMLLTGYSDRQTWDCLKKCWRGFQKYRRLDKKDRIYKYARKIHFLAKSLNLTTYHFTDFDFEFQPRACSYKKNPKVYADLRPVESAPLTPLDKLCWYKSNYTPTQRVMRTQEFADKSDEACWYKNNIYAQHTRYVAAQRKYARRKSCLYRV